jgi:hypothetical protein
MDLGNLWKFQLHLGSVKAVKGPDVSCLIISIYIIYIYVSVFFSLPSIPRLGRRPSYVSWCILESQLLGWGARRPRYGERGWRFMDLWRFKGFEWS